MASEEIWSEDLEGKSIFLNTENGRPTIAGSNVEISNLVSYSISSWPGSAPKILMKLAHFNTDGTLFCEEDARCPLLFSFFSNDEPGEDGG